MDGYMKGGNFKHLYKAGGDMGYKTGGKVTSSDSKMKSGKMDSMDHANIQRTKSTNQRDAESGGKTPVRPKFKKGGKKPS